MVSFYQFMDRLKALCTAGADFMETPALYRVKIQGEWMTREDVAAALREAAGNRPEGERLEAQTLPPDAAARAARD